MKIMSTNIRNKFLYFFLIIAILPIAAFADIKKINKDITPTKVDSISVDELVENILKSTEDALVNVESNPQSSLLSVKKAITKVEMLKDQLSHDTHAENKSPLIINGSKEYWFIYPPVSNDVLQDKTTFPTIYSKLKNGIMYQGNNNKQNDSSAAYFDYAFAKASLLTAREALVAENTREAISSLKWVFEAIYMNPNFYVADLNDALMIDKLINSETNHSFFSQSN